MDMAIEVRAGAWRERVIAFGLMFALYPVLLLSITAVFVPGKPVLRRTAVQERSGRRYFLYELNLPDMDRADDPVHALIIRSRVDRLPRLINVLRGDIPLRPCPGRPSFLENAEEFA